MAQDDSQVAKTIADASGLQANDPLTPGLPIIIGGRTYIAPPIAVSLKSAKPVYSREPETWVDRLLVGLILALKPNYPDITREWIEDNLQLAEAPFAQMKINELFDAPFIAARLSEQERMSASERPKLTVVPFSSPKQGEN